MKITTQHWLASLFMLALLASCSRPMAYFQTGTREQYAAMPAQIKSANSVESPAPITVIVSASDVATAPAGQLAQATNAMAQVDALVSNDSKLAADKTIKKRLNRIRTLLAVAPTKSITAPVATNAPKKINLMERVMLKKINKKISRQLAPANPEKAMAIKGILAFGAVLVLAGILLLVLTAGTGQTIGVIAVLGGLVLLLLGLL